MKILKKDSKSAQNTLTKLSRNAQKYSQNAQKHSNNAQVFFDVHSEVIDLRRKLRGFEQMNASLACEVDRQRKEIESLKRARQIRTTRRNLVS